MNTSASTSTSSSNAPSRAGGEDARRSDPRHLCREGERFDRLLRDKAGPRDDNDDTQPIAPAPDGATPLPTGAPAPAPPGAAAAAAVPRAGAAAADTPSATQAALGSAMAAQAPPRTEAGAADAQAFQVSIHEPTGMALELRAVRVAGAAGTPAPAQWALHIAAPARDAATLARHGPRLDERLRARGLDGTAVHVEPEDRDDDAAE